MSKAKKENYSIHFFIKFNVFSFLFKPKKETHFTKVFFIKVM